MLLNWLIKSQEQNPFLLIVTDKTVFTTKRFVSLNTISIFFMKPKQQFRIFHDKTFEPNIIKKSC